MVKVCQLIKDILG